MPSGYSTAAGGGVLTPERVIPVLFDPLAAKSVVLQAIPRSNIFDAGGGAPVRVPRIASINLADPWRSENTQIAEVDPVYDELTLLPTSLKSLKVLHRLSNELARNSVGNVERLIGTAFINAVAREWDKAALAGTGASNTVTGLAATSGAQTMTTVGAISVDKLYDAIALLLGANADLTTSAWFMNPARYVGAHKLRADGTTGAYLLQPDPAEPGRQTLLGPRVYVSTQVPTGTVILADMAQVAVGRDLEPRLDVLRETYGNFDQVALRIVARLDIGAINPDAVVVMTGVS
jgi:HK97 family phage major capsid protein